MQSFAGHALLRLVAATLCLQLLFWLAISPALITVKPGPFEAIALQSYETARVAAPTGDALAAATFAQPPGGSVLYDTGYHATRVTFSLDEVPANGLALLDQNGGDNVRMWANGSVFHTEGSMALDALTYHGLRKDILHIPAGLLRSGENHVESVMATGLPRLGGSHPPLIGDYDRIEASFGYKAFLLNEGKLIAVVAGFVIFFFAALATIRARNRDFPFWLAVLTLAWTLHNQFFLWADMPIHGAARGFYYAFFMLLVSAAWPVFVDAWTGRPSRWFRRAICATFAGAVLWCGWWLFVDAGPLAFSHVEDALDLVGLALMAATLARLVWHFATVRDERRHWEAALLLSLALLIALFLYSLFVDGLRTQHLAITQPLFLLAIALAFFGRNFRLFRSQEDLTAELCETLEAREAELAVAHAREKELVRQDALTQERQRIMRDMHDGLGSNLMSMLMMARRGQAKAGDFAEGIQSVIDEMRLMIDSMDSVGESLALALTIFRKRVAQRVEDAGFAFEWNMAADLALPGPGPRDVLQVFRILQEAVTNAMKHSGGDRIEVAVTSSGQPGHPLRIAVSDNGRGLAGDGKRGRGRGLVNMQARARSIGAELAIKGDAAGTTVELLLPGNAPVPD